MIVRDEHLDSFVNKGDEFEMMIHSLVCAEGWICGVSPDQIDWDHRTSLPDGGRDVVVRVGNDRTDRQFIPRVKSVWSAKSGNNGLKTSTFQNEVRTHTKVISHLKDGGAYIWCVAPAADHDKRDALRNKAIDLGKEFGFDGEKQISFFFRDVITSWLKQHLGLIPVYFPDLPHRWETLTEWKSRDKNHGSAWVDFGDRAELVEKIRQHLLATSGNNVLHLAGFSGVGKTRTAQKACEDPSLEGVLYFPSLHTFESEFEAHLRRSNGICATIVIDEVRIEESDLLQTRLSAFQNRLRVVTIGAATSKSSEFLENVQWVSPPDTVTDVIKVIRSGDPSLSTEQAQNIANWCDRDLRLALFLTEANKRDPGLAGQPLTSVDLVWSRVTDLFKSEIGDVERFRDAYEILCLCQDIGSAGEKLFELERLAEYFNKPAPEMQRVIAQARDVGLGRQQGEFFEAAPRALARRIFERWAWARIDNDAFRFLSSLPTKRLQRKFFERIQECDQRTKRAFAKTLKAWLDSQFPEWDLALLSDQDSSEVFASYTLTAPDLGLFWLNRAVERASSDQLLEFEDKSNSSDTSHSRRQIVSLGLQLAQFPEYFPVCEAILFRLAQYEPEKSADDNSLKGWQRLFLPILSNTPLSFDERWDRLMNRLSQAADRQLPIIIEAAMEALRQSCEDFITGIGLPQTVGGRPVPPMWEPVFVNDLKKMASAAAAQLIEKIRELPPDYQKVSRTAVINYVGAFIQLGCLDKLGEWLTPQSLDDGELRQLRIRIDYYIEHVKIRAEDSAQYGRIPRDYEKEWVERKLEHVLPWRRSLDPQSLYDRIKDVTGRDASMYMAGGWMSREGINAVYEGLASDTLKAPEELNGLWDWFNSDGPRSASEFGSALGKLDINGVFEKDVLDQLTQGRCVDLVTGYFAAVRTRRGGTPAVLTTALDSMAADHPDATMFVTGRADISESGLDRLLRLTPHASPGAYSLLGRILQWHAWYGHLSDARQAQAVALLADVGRAGQPEAYGLALEMAYMWTTGDRKFPAVLADAVLPVLAKLLEQPLLPDTRHYWMLGVGKLPHSHLSHKIDLLIEAVKGRFSLRSDAIDRLEAILRSHPTEASSILEARIHKIDPENIGLLGNLLSVFDSDQIETVQRLVRRFGVIGARALAKHLIAPYPTADDPMYVPPMTAWLLEEFEADDQVFSLFCTSLHNRRGYFGNGRNYSIETLERMTPYLSHLLRRVREWARLQLNSAKGEIE